MPIRAARPYRGHVDAGPKGVSWGSAIRARTHSCKGYRAAGIEPAAATLAGRARYLSCHPHGQASARGLRPAVSWCSRLWTCHMTRACTRGSQGRQKLNPHLAGFGDRLPIRWLIPKQTKTAPRGFPRGGCRQVPPRAYTTTIRPIKAAASCETGCIYPARPGACRIVIYSW